MPNMMITVVLVVMIAISAVTISAVIGVPAVRSGISTREVMDAESDMRKLDKVIREVVDEGEGSTRQYVFSSPTQFRASAAENSIEFSSRINVEASDYLSRTVSGNVISINGDDVFCEEKDGTGDGVADLVLENQLVKFVFNRTQKAAPHPPIDTTTSILSITDKTNNATIRPVNSSVEIDGGSARGTGFSEILDAGNAKPSCAVRFFVNSTRSYDVLYRLYAGADFVVMEVHNIK